MFVLTLSNDLQKIHDSGVPQGSSVGPILYTLNIKDLILWTTFLFWIFCWFLLIIFSQRSVGEQGILTFILDFLCYSICLLIYLTNINETFATAYKHPLLLNKTFLFVIIILDCILILFTRCKCNNAIFQN